MGVTKKEIHSENDLDVASIARILAHPARIQIIKFLLEQGSCSMALITDEIKLARQTVRQHVQVLQDGSLICISSVSPHICFCIDPDRWNHYREIFEVFF